MEEGRLEDGPLPGPPGDELRGTYSSVDGAGTVDGRVIATRALTFLPGRRFRREGFGSVSAPGAVAASSSTREGTYQLDGSTLELRYEDGVAERHAFLTARSAAYITR